MMDMSLVWLFIVIAAGIFEAVTVDLVSIWFCVGGLIAMLLAYFNVALWIQIVAFSIVSILLIVCTRPLARKILRGNIVRTNSDCLIGKHGLVTRALSLDERGEVKVAGEYWSAIPRDDIKVLEGEHVEILAIEGVKLIVRPLN